MTTEQQTKHTGASGISRYKSVIALAAMPVILALATNGFNVQAIPPTLTDGVFPIGFTLLAWGLSAGLAYKLRRQ